MALPLEFVVRRHPISQQARRGSLVRRWIEIVQDLARQNWPASEEIVASPVMLTIIYYYNIHLIDIDNMPKPILDALKGLVFEDDSQVTDLICRKRYRHDNEYVHIIVAEAPDQEGTP